MDRFDRIFALHQLLSASRLPVPRRRIEQELECSRATAKRIIDNLRDYLNAPIEYDRRRNGYYYRDGDLGEMFELPGVWFNASELQALLGVQQLLSDLQPGLLERQLAPLRQRIGKLLAAQHPGGQGLTGRIRILRAAARPAGDHFQAIAGALAQRRRLRIDYYDRRRDRTLAREISPQRLSHYRDNWYLEAWCHLRDGLRTFALDAIHGQRRLDTPAIEVDPGELDRFTQAAYGIFTGAPEQWATLLFSARQARWVGSEQWHPQQRSEWLDDGRYRLEVPYSNPFELTMDILKYGPDVEVLAPESLRAAVRERLAAALARYE